MPKKSTSKKVIRIIKGFQTGEEVPENAIYMSTVMEEYGRPQLKQITHYFMVYVLTSKK